MINFSAVEVTIRSMVESEPTTSTGSGNRYGHVCQLNCGCDGQPRYQLPNQQASCSGDRIANVENIIGSAFADNLRGNSGNNVINAGAGDDTIHATAGNDTIIGGAGNDVLILSGNRSHYAVTNNAGTLTITDLRNDAPNGVQTVSDVELFRFADGDLSSSNVVSISSIAAPIVRRLTTAV